MTLIRLLFSRFTLLLFAVVLIASLLPAQGSAARLFEHISSAAIVLLFFMHGAKLSRRAIIAGLTHWRLHLLVFSFTFIAFPLIGLLSSPMTQPLLGQELFIGLLYLCALPGTVQSAIAFTSLARGNIPAAVCSASASSLIGIVVTPLVFGLMADVGQSQQAGSLWQAIVHIAELLLLPFVLGHLSRPLVGSLIERHKPLLGWVDQISILLIVYSAFSESVVAGLWHQVPWSSLLLLGLVLCLLLALVLFFTTQLARRLGFNKEDEITIVFCGSKKSLATGVPMAQVMFSGAAIGPILLPIMIFHQLQLMVCSVLAQRYAARPDNDNNSTEQLYDSANGRRTGG